MRLSKKNNWEYSNVEFNRDTIFKFAKTNSWIYFIRNALINSYAQPLDYLELGCAPGICTAALVHGSNWNISGIDFSDKADVFVETLAQVNKEANLYKFDLLVDSFDKKFDIVTSFGLIEHFLDESLDQIVRIHDHYLQSRGTLIIEVPNFNGFQYFWHKLFDSLDLKIHNLQIMSPLVISEFYKKLGYEITFCDYVGKLHVWGSSTSTHILFKLIAKLLAKSVNITSAILSSIGLEIHGKNYSPAILLIAVKP